MLVGVVGHLWLAKFVAIHFSHAKSGAEKAWKQCYNVPRGTAYRKVAGAHYFGQLLLFSPPIEQMQLAVLNEAVDDALCAGHLAEKVPACLVEVALCNNRFVTLWSDSVVIGILKCFTVETEAESIDGRVSAENHKVIHIGQPHIIGVDNALDIGA